MKFILFFLFEIIFCAHVFAQDAVSSISKGNEYYKQSQFALAETQYRQALEADPKNSAAQYNLANALQKQKKYDEAIELLDKLSATVTDKDLNSFSYYNQGVAYSKLKNLEASIESYKQSLRLKPDDKEARENLQKALLELKKQQQQQNQKQKRDQKMSQKEAEQKLKLLQQKEKNLQQRLQNQGKQDGKPQKQDW